MAQNNQKWDDKQQSLPRSVNDGSFVKLNNNQFVIIPSKRPNSFGEIVIFNKHREPQWEKIRIDFPNDFPRWANLTSCLGTKSNTILIHCKNLIFELNIGDRKITQKKLNIPQDTQYEYLNWSQLINVNNNIYVITKYPLQNKYKQQLLHENKDNKHRLHYEL